jgi:hypothetical protein
LPPDALRLIKHLRCDDYDSETTSVTLGRRGAADYKICCHEPDHGPCEAIVIGQIGGRWRNLTANDSILGFDGCTGFIPLESQHDGFHDICLSEQGSNVTPIVRGAPQIPALLQFKAGQYREVRNPPPE